MKQPAFCRIFADRAAAEERARIKNLANRASGWIWVVVEGPTEEFAVVDLGTAIELGANYSWTSGLRSVRARPVAGSA